MAGRNGQYVTGFQPPSEPGLRGQRTRTVACGAPVFILLHIVKTILDVAPVGKHSPQILYGSRLLSAVRQRAIHTGLTLLDAPRRRQYSSPMMTRARFIMLNLYHILVDGLFDTVPVILSFMALACGSGETEVGLIVSLGTALSTAAGLGTGWFSRRFGFAGSVALLTGLAGLGMLGAGLASASSGWTAPGAAGGMPVAGACMLLVMAGFAVFHNLSFSYITANTERARLGRVMSDFTAIGDVGRIPLVSFAAFAAAYSVGSMPGWQAICLAYGTVALCASLWLYCARGNFAAAGESGNSAASTPATPKRTRRNPFAAFAILKNRNVFLAMLASVLNAFSNDRIFTFLPLLLVAKGMDAKTIGSFALGFTLGSFAGKMACGRLIDIFGTRRIFIGAGLALTLLLCGLLASNNLALTVLLALAIGIVTKGTVPVIQTIITEPVQGTRTYDAVFTVNSFGRGITNILTPTLFGGLAALWSMDAVYMLMAAVAALSIVPVVLMGRAQGPSAG